MDPDQCCAEFLDALAAVGAPRRAAIAPALDNAHPASGLSTEGRKLICVTYSGPTRRSKFPSNHFLLRTSRPTRSSRRRQYTEDRHTGVDECMRARRQSGAVLVLAHSLARDARTDSCRPALRGVLH